MKLIVVHQILIVSAIALAILFGIRAASIYAQTRATNDILLAVASAVVAVALTIYLRKVRAKWLSERGSPRAA
jgi:hypothetical protein